MIRFFKTVFTFLIFILGICIIAFLMLVGKNYKTASESRNVSITQSANDAIIQFKTISKDIDPDKIADVMDYVKKKAKDGSLNSKEGTEKAIKDGAADCGIAISDDTARQILDALDSLEDLGFSTQDIAEATSKTYEKYGNEFLDHMEEAFVEAAKDAAGNTAQNIWDSFEKTVKDSF